MFNSIDVYLQPSGSCRLISTVISQIKKNIGEIKKNRKIQSKKYLL